MIISVAHCGTMVYMGLFLINKTSGASCKSASLPILRAKAMQNSKVEKPEFDGSKDIAYLEGTKETTTLAGAWVLIALVACGLVITFIVQVM